VPLTDDQRAMLRLLAQREEGYEDIAALKGLSVEEVKAEVKAALAELAADSEAEAAPSPAAEPPKAEDPPKAEEPPEPTKEEPKTEEPPKPKPAAAPAPRSSRPALPPERRRFLILAGGGLGIVAVVLIAIALVGGGGGGGSSTTSTASATEPAAEGAEAGKVTQAVLEPVDGGSASGRALFGRLGKEVVLQVAAEGLEPTSSGESYTVWLYRTPKLVLRVGSVAVGDSGKLGARFPIPTELLAYVASGAFTQIYVSRTSDAAYQREVARAKQQKSLPRYTGETVLAGEITGPVVKVGSAEGG
jgi:hypothetical protein